MATQLVDCECKDERIEDDIVGEKTVLLKTHKRLKERFLTRRNRTKRAKAFRHTLITDFSL